MGRLAVANDHGVEPVRDVVNKDLWSGPAARTLQDDLLDPMKGTVEAQKRCVSMLAQTTQWYAELVTSAADDIVTIADDCVAHLRAAVSGSLAGAANATSLVSGLVGLISSALLLGLLSTGAGMVSTLAGQREAAQDAQRQQLHHAVLDGSVPEILRSALAAIDELESALAAADERIADALTAALAHRYFDESGKLWPGRPDLAGGQDELLRSFGRVMVVDSLVVDWIVDLYRGGYFHLPLAAAQFRTAAAQLSDACRISGIEWYWVSDFFPRSFHLFSEARGILGNSMRRAHVDLTEAGERLLGVAEGYELAEEQNAELLRRIEMVPDEIRSVELGLMSSASGP